MVLLCHIDVEDVVKPLREVTRAAALNGCTLVCAWSPEVRGGCKGRPLKRWGRGLVGRPIRGRGGGDGGRNKGTPVRGGRGGCERLMMGGSTCGRLREAHDGR